MKYDTDKRLEELRQIYLGRNYKNKIIRKEFVLKTFQIIPDNYERAKHNDK